MKEIITGKKEQIKILIDSEDFERVSKRRWYKNKQNYVFTYLGKKPNRKLILLHRFLLNPTKDKVIDHINHNRLDNRKHNLRICQIGENSKNRAHRKFVGKNLKRIPSSKFKGVYFDKQFRTWIGEFRVKKFFKREIDAATFYDDMAKKINGEFAVTNKSLGYL